MKFLKMFAAVLLLCMSGISVDMLAAHPSEYGPDETSDPTHFILSLQDGQQIAFVLEHSPKVVHGEGMIEVVDRDITLEYSLDNVYKYTLGVPTETGIGDAGLAADALHGQVSYQYGDVILSGFDADVPVTVTDLNGIVVYRGETDAAGALVVSMSPYPTGVYVIQVQNKTFKFIKR